VYRLPLTRRSQEPRKVCLTRSVGVADEGDAVDVEHERLDRSVRRVVQQHVLHVEIVMPCLRRAHRGNEVGGRGERLLANRPLVGHQRH